MLLTILPSGALARRVGPRATAFSGLVLLAAATLAFGLASEQWTLMVLRLVMGVGGTLAFTGVMAWQLDTVPAERRGRFMGTMLAATFTGASFGPLLGALALAVGITATFAVVGLLSLLLAGVVLCTQVPLSKAPSGADGPRREGLSRFARALMVALFVIAMAMGARFVLPPLDLAGQGASDGLVGVIFAASALLMSVVALVGGRVVDRRGPDLLLAVGLAATACSLLLFSVAATLAFTAAVTVASSIGLQLATTAALALLAHESQRAGLDGGTSWSYMNLAWTGGCLAGALLVGWLSERTPGAVSWLTLAALVAVGGGSLLWSHPACPAARSRGS
jgi:MFS family permease